MQDNNIKYNKRIIVHHKISKYHTILGNDVVMTILCNIAWYAWMLFSPEIGWHG